ncbi:MAG: AAA family ATPase, partial [Rhodobacteraceae bacterium]|nr:AAA family ATPase [Paracoccaceae bacterium]
MRFTKLRLNGFKSFVDPTEMVIADGLTGIVGPNGCGKSNLLEALRWVMGENRPTAMRGDGMEDVIFAGTASRPARNFAEVAVSIDNSERLAPQGFNDSDYLDIARRITRDAGSAYKFNSKDVRARDVQMLFADASTGAHSPALVRQGQISELINARPRSRRRILEEAAGISGLYQRRHEAELKLRGAETNLSRVDDVIEQLAQQLAQLARQARQAARYRELSEGLRRAEGLLLYRRWREADEALRTAQTTLTGQTTAASQAERAARAAETARQTAEEALPPLREEEAIASAVLQRLAVQRDTLTDEEDRARKSIETLEARIAQLARDAEREEALNRDAEATIARLAEEAETLAQESAGHDEALDAAAAEAREAAAVLQEREAALAQMTEDVARLAARHHSAQRLRDDAEKMLARHEGEAEKANADATDARAIQAEAETAFTAAQAALATATQAASAAEDALASADEERGAAQAREAEARASRSEAEGEVSALQAEVNALARLVQRDTAESGQVLDLVGVDTGFEKALGAALADDLRAPAIKSGDATGWVVLPPYDTAQSLPEGVPVLTAHVTVPDVLARRLAQVGLVDRADGARLQSELKPGQRIVSVEGDLWRWDGFRAGAEDAPSAAALRLQQLNRLQELKQDLEEASARAEGAARAHEHLKTAFAEVTRADAEARDARRRADTAVTEASRALSRAEADRNIAEGKLESLRLAARRHEEDALEARGRLKEAEAAIAGLDDLDAARAEAEDVRITVDAARMTMMTRRSAHDELRRAGEARERRIEANTREAASWRTRLETAGQRIAELATRKAGFEEELAAARGRPAELAKDRERLADEIALAETRRKEAADALAEAETALRKA